MRTNPFYDAFLFLTGTDDFHKGGGWQGTLMVPIYWALLIASIWIAWRVWQSDPSQRSAAAVWTWVTRAMIGTMWFEGSLWKLPIPGGGGFAYWVDVMEKNSAFAVHQAFVTYIIKPLFPIVHPLVFLTELTLAASFILGFGVRLMGVVGALFALNIYVGLFRVQAEWPWAYWNLVLIQGLFAAIAAGRSLGLDALLRRGRAPATEKTSVLTRLYDLSS